MSRTYRLFRVYFGSIPITLRLDGPAVRTTFNGIAAPAKARQLSARAETETTLTGTIQTAFARLIAIETASIRSASQKSKR